MGIFFMTQDLQWKLNIYYANNPNINYSDVFIANEPQVKTFLKLQSFWKLF